MDITLTPIQVNLLLRVLPTLQFQCTTENFEDLTNEVLEVKALIEKLKVNT